MKILLATDGSDASARAARLIAPFLSETDEVGVVVVLSYALHPYGEGEDPERLERVKTASAAADAVAKPVVDTLSHLGDRVSVGYRFGYPSDEIALEADEWEPDIIVLGRRGLRGPVRWLGSVSEHVLHHAKVPVLLVP